MSKENIKSYLNECMESNEKTMEAIELIENGIIAPQEVFDSLK